jgi:hypothetical protein
MTRQASFITNNESVNKLFKSNRFLALPLTEVKGTALCGWDRIRKKLSRKRAKMGEQGQKMVRKPEGKKME